MLPELFSLAFKRSLLLFSCLLVVLFISTEISAQARLRSPDFPKSAEALKNAEFIFEGYAKESNYTYCRGYYEYDSSALLVAYKLTVVHCYKGSLEKGEVTLIRPMTYEEHKVGIPLNTPIIFLCNRSDFEAVCEKNLGANNKQPLRLINEGYIGRFYPCLGLNQFVIDSITYEVGGLYNLNFRTKDEFHNFLLKSSEGITLPQQSEEKLPIPDKPAPSRHLPDVKPDSSDQGDFGPGQEQEYLVVC